MANCDDLISESTSCGSVASVEDANSPKNQQVFETFDEQVSQETFPKERKPSLPARALQSRLQARSAPPSWMAWLPPGLQQTQNTGAVQTNEASAPAGFCQDLVPMTPVDPTYATHDDCYLTDQNQGCFVMDGVMYQPVVFQIQPDMVNDYGYYAGSPSELEYAHFGGEALQDSFSVGPLVGNIWKLAKDSQGCRQVQQAFDESSSEEERMHLTSELMGHVWEALKCPNANHVVQKCISTIRPEAAQFIIEELIHHGPGGAAQAARHRFGCRIIERLLEHCSAEQMSPLVEALLADVVALSSHMYGNFVVQHLLEHCDSDVVARIVSALVKHMTTFAADGYAGSVMGKALRQSATPENLPLVKALLKDPERLTVMACSRWGHLAVKQAMQLADAPMRRQAGTDLKRRLGRYRSSRYGRLVANFINEQQSSAICVN